MLSYYGTLTSSGMKYTNTQSYPQRAGIKTYVSRGKEQKFENFHGLNGST